MTSNQLPDAVHLDDLREIERVIESSALAALKGPQDFIASMVETFKKRRDILVSGLRAIEGVLETETFVYLRILKQNYEWGTATP